MLKDNSITVLMTVYNAQGYLDKSIQSVLNQTYRDFEFLIIDDGSRDESVEKIKAYQKVDPRIVLYINSKNIGQTSSLNRGFELARGKYVARIDADDIAFAHWLQSQVDFLKKNGDVDVLSAGLVTFGEKGLGKVYFSPFCRQDLLLKAIIKSPLNHGSAFIRKDAILNIGAYSNNYKIAADYGVWTNFLRKNGSIASNPNIVMAIRMHADSESEKNRLTQALKEIAEISGQHVQFLTGMDLSEEESLLMCRAHYDEGGLNRQDFLRAVEIHKNVYASLKRDLNLNKKKVRFWYKKQVRTFFLRRIYWYILQHKRIEVRAAAQECLRRTGFSPVFVGLFILSFFPQLFLDFILKTYNFIHTVIAQVFMMERKIPLLKRSIR
ncbi:MAG: glycosyltransferase [Candidatus Omnitrophota bacterium]|nr:glycosyltransferase [Candidatus Omnitrophota bacterium]